LGPIDIPLADIRRIEFHRDPVSAPTSPGSASATSEPSALVPWDESSATFERRDGTTAVVPATSVALACATGMLQFKNGQDVSLELVGSVRFDSVNVDNASADGVVVLLDGRELDDPIHTWNCPVSGRTELGPIDIPLADIRRIEFHR
jgi:hypothetical protein